MVTSTVAGTPAPESLSIPHRHELEVLSGIHPDIIAERGYGTVQADGLPTQFPDYQRKDGLLIPIHTVWGTVGSFQLKPDKPRIKHGKPVKYETIPGQPLCLDVPRRVLPHLGNPLYPLWITEGAKKVDAGLTMGLGAVIGLQGVYGWRGTNGAGGKTALPDWEAIALNDRPVVLAFDSDCMTKPEVRGALDRLSAFLTSRGAEVRYLLMPPLADGGKCGLDDFLVGGKTRNDIKDFIVTELPPMDAGEEDAVPDVVWVSEVAAEQIEWLWPGWIPKRMLTILGGYGGDGKSTVMASLIARWTTGGRLPDDVMAPRTKVLMLSAEDDIAYAIRPRLEAHGADIGKVMVLKGTHAGDRAGRSRWLDLRRDVAIMERLVTEHDMGLIVIDPLSSYLPHADRNSEGDIRDALQPLMGLMERTGVAIVGIMHVGKSGDNRRAAQRLLGSTAFTALARSVLMLADLPDDRQPDDVGELGKLKVLQVVKSNYAVPPPPRLFRRPLDRAIRWEGESALTVEECFAGASSKRGPEPVERIEAAEALREILANGPLPIAEVTATAKEMGISGSAVKRAKIALGVKAFRRAFDGPWMWQLDRVAN